MVYTLIVPALLICLQSTILHSVRCEKIDVGNILVPSDKGFAFAGTTFILDDVFPEDGIITGFKAYFQNRNYIRFQIWRPIEASTSTVKLKLINAVTIEPTVINKEVLVPWTSFLSIESGWCLQVARGDRLGVLILAAPSSITYEYALDKSYVLVHTENRRINYPRLNDVVTFDALNFPFYIIVSAVVEIGEINSNGSYILRSCEETLVVGTTPAVTTSTEPVVYPIGPAGKNGTDGVAGRPGEKGEIGPPGLPGFNGRKGDQGPPGPPGTGAQGLQGEPGPPGDQGEKGQTGLTGPQGPPGVNGSKGPKGDTGEKGEAGSPGIPATSIHGITKGDKGEIGSPGPEGPAGKQGPSGIRGITGSQGAKGNRGSPGLQGPPGPPYIPSAPTTNGTNISHILFGDSVLGDGVDEYRVSHTVVVFVLVWQVLITLAFIALCMSIIIRRQTKKNKVHDYPWLGDSMLRRLGEIYEETVVQKKTANPLKSGKYKANISWLQTNASQITVRSSMSGHDRMKEDDAQ